ncbi:thioredoxin-like protein [Crepidotus variabilis]|uniref:Thioredoxin-like protein n=1 Tax=Crepidotus variabilis TaxID=179855 RepID=A0A9P6JUR4_9AGAR|nr:thioredoxin-like protein [Crepidotus variabilis]
MSLQPSLRPLIILGNRNAPHTLDVFLDYVCPFSKKMAGKLDSIVKPLISNGGKYDGKIKVIFRLQTQPWHAMSTITHEAGLAALHASSEHFWPYSLALFEHQDEYFDIPTQDLTIRQVRENLAKLAATVLPSNTIEKFKDLLALKSTPNGGNAVTDDLKYNIKFSRQNGIHVSPSVLLDGLFQSQVSSGWEEKEWSEFLGKAITV